MFSFAGFGVTDMTKWIGSIREKYYCIGKCTNKHFIKDSDWIGGRCPHCNSYINECKLFDDAWIAACLLTEQLQVSHTSASERAV